MEYGSRIESLNILETRQYPQHSFKSLSRIVILCCFVLQTFSFVIDSIPTTSAFVPHSHHYVSTEIISTSLARTIPYISNPTSKSSTAIFGIKGFRAWFEDQFPNAVSNVDVDQHPDTFDHVLIDMNQILHTVLRRSRNNEQAIKFLMVELDTLVQRCRPSQSLVLAIDGSAAAAKLATQRKRRYSIMKNTRFKLKHSNKLRLNKKKRAKRMRNYKAELRSLQLTPGTDCMKTLESAILYWSWQRLQNLGKPHSRLLPKVRIYISTSQVPGEGEIKLLEWINNFRGMLSRNPGQSIALVGGDADLLLEAMVIPPSWTHNVFVMRPEDPDSSKRKKKNSSLHTGKGSPKKQTFNTWTKRNTLHCVSLWEMTLSLDEYCRRNFPKELYNPDERPEDQNLLLQIRTDMVLLFMLNGNDYLPRVVAVGFRNVLSTYLLLLENWARRTETLTNIGLIDPNTLNFRSDFCADFFTILGKKAPTDRERMKSFTRSKNPKKKTYQSILNDMSAIGFLPTPIHFDVFDKSEMDFEGIEFQDQEIEAEDDMFEDEDDMDFDGDVDEIDDDDDNNDDDSIDDDDDDDDAENLEAYKDSPEVQIMQLSLGNKNGRDYHEYHVRVNSTSNASLQRAKGKLSKMALEEFELLGHVDENFDAGKDYEWELDFPAKASIQRYLAGLIWTLQTYQEGVVPSYQYNYGKCLAPSGREIAQFFLTAMHENRDVGAKELLSDFEVGGSIKAGVACLAALPISAKHLVPKPYSLLDDDVVEGIYSDCMNSTDNFFYLKKFENLVDAAVERLAGETKGGLVDANASNSKENHSRDIILGNHYWTVLKQLPKSAQNTKPHNPPPPPAEEFAYLRPNHRIKASRIICMDMPRTRNSLNHTSLNSWSSKSNYPRKFFDQNNILIDHSSFGSMINGSESSILKTPYKIAFCDSPGTYGGSQSSKPKSSFELLKSNDNSVEVNIFKLLKSESDIDNEGLEKFYRTSPEGHTATLTLKQLRDLQMLKSFDFVDSDGEYNLTVLFDTIPLDDVTFSVLLYPKSKLKLVKQYLASQALDAIMHPGKSIETSENDNVEVSEPRWYHLTFDELKEFLMAQYPTTRDTTKVQVNPENLTSVVFFNQLRQIGIVESGEFSESPASEDNLETISFSFKARSMQVETLVYERYNLARTKKWIKQHLTSLALDVILKDLGVGKDDKSHWYDFSFQDFKNRINVGSKRPRAKRAKR